MKIRINISIERHSILILTLFTVNPSGLSSGTKKLWCWSPTPAKLKFLSNQSRYYFHAKKKEILKLDPSPDGKFFAKNNATFLLLSNFSYFLN